MRRRWTVGALTGFGRFAETRVRRGPAILNACGHCFALACYMRLRLPESRRRPAHKPASLTHGKPPRSVTKCISIGDIHRNNTCGVLVCATLVGAGLLVGCGGGPSPINPSPSSYPAVAGTYAGTVTSTSSLGSVVCPASTIVTQSGAVVQIGQLFSACASIEGLLVAPGNFTMTTTGALGTLNVNLSDPTCNGTYDWTATAAFSGSTLQFSSALTPVSGGCVTSRGSSSLSGTMNRQ